MATKTKSKAKGRGSQITSKRVIVASSKTVTLANGKVVQVRAIAGLKGVGLIRDGRTQKLELRARLQMPRPIFGKIVNVAERTIADVEAGKNSIGKLKRPYNEVYRLYEALSDVIAPEFLGQWFQTPNESFDGHTPMDLIEQGEIDQLWNMVFELQTGMPG